VNEKTINAHHTGGLRFVVSTGSGHDVISDDGESDTGPRPTELLLASLVACAAMDVVSLLVKKRQQFTDFRVEGRGSQQADYPQVYTEIELIHIVEGPAIEEQAVRRSIELSATKYCPINAMVSAGPTAVHHRYRIIDPSEQAGGTREGEVIVTGPNAWRPAVTS